MRSLSCYWWIARSQAIRQITTLPLSELHFESRNELTKLSLHLSSLKRSFLSVLFGTKHPLLRTSRVIFLSLRGTYKNAKYIMVCGFLFFNVIFRVLVVRYWWAFGAVVCDLWVVTDGSHATARSQATKSLRASLPNSHQVWRNSTGLISYKGNYVCCVCKKRLWSWSI